MLAARTFRSFSSSVRRATRGVSSRVRPQVAASGQPWTAGIITAGVVIGSYAGYTILNPVRLDAPDRKAPKPSEAAPRHIPYEEVQKHNTRESCWVIIDGQVYDATSVLEWHPGGAAVILRNAGKDATKAFVPIHPPNTLQHLPMEAHIGPVDPATIPEDANKPTEDEIRVAEARQNLPPPSAAINLHDIEILAEKVLTRTAWAYYRSTADDEATYFENSNAFKRFWFRPRVMNKVSQISTATTLFGIPSSLPIFICPAALYRLGHPDGEMNAVRAAGQEGIIQGISNNASCSTEECVSAKLPGQGLVFQLYLNKDRRASEALVKKIEAQGFKAIMLTVDSAVPGKRELDQRAKGEDFNDGPSTFGKSESSGLGVAHAISGYQDPDILWDDIPWLRRITKLPIIIKGVQCVEDAEKAFEEYGVKAIILSNHGGRELDYSPAPMTILYELYQRRPDLLKKNEVYIDGGVRRGTDVLKALCLGARGSASGGRSFMREEIETGMRLLGVTSLDQLRPELLSYMDKRLGQPERRSNRS
ncbi:FMN-dependent dehydrogenase-domain-containing protein [Fomitopsis serialis]|uniref:FMN-dependent dehydrogenase-domain-containing protein n=1 Tax=Fomitopsis serialis TaxID=139415 RepID=UPI0020086731|nr:FMN-dependent dehydrogenase-domain-containing protein [Neoantrodia serialis]KAH9926689.1 FMN-dependent dehydrogenase-domain-containing protein [Neoantrodia serialis]